MRLAFTVLFLLASTAFADSSVRNKLSVLNDTPTTYAQIAPTGSYIYATGRTPLTIRSTDSTSLTAAVILDRATLSAANNDILSEIEFRGRDAGLFNASYATIQAKIRDAMATLTDGILSFFVTLNGVEREILTIDGEGATVSGSLWSNDTVTVLANTEKVRLNGTLYVWAGGLGNVGTAEDDLTSFSLPAATLASDGESLEIQCFGGFNTVGATARLYFDGVELDNVSAAAIDDDWSFRATIIRTGATAQTAICETLVGTGGDGGANIVFPSATLANAVTIKVTGDGVSADNEVMARGLIVSWRGNSTY